MAAVREIRAKPAFFTRKNESDDGLCERCRKHKYVIMARFGCDYYVYTTITPTIPTGTTLHIWCGAAEDPAPKCIYGFKFEKFLDD